MPPVFSVSARLSRLALCLGLLVSPSAAPAHEFWLVPHQPATGVGSRVTVELRIGDIWPGVQSTRLPNLVDWFQATDALGTRDVAGSEGSPDVGNLEARVAGATVVAMRTKPWHIELSAAEFNQYLREEGLDEILDSRRRSGLGKAPAREDFSRCAKSIVFVDGDSRGFDRLTGLPLELLPQTDPLAFRAGQPFRVKLLFNGKPLANNLIKAQLKADPPVELTANSDAGGNVAFALPSAGWWLFNAVHMFPSSEAGSDWESLWASLTFEIPAAGQR